MNKINLNYLITTCSPLCYNSILEEIHAYLAWQFANQIIEVIKYDAEYPKLLRIKAPEPLLQIKAPEL
jgi:DNA-binding GntR family transcriptional regulator